MQSLVMIVDCYRKHFLAISCPIIKRLSSRLIWLGVRFLLILFFLLFRLGHIHAYMFSPLFSHLNISFLVYVVAEDCGNNAGTCVTYKNMTIVRTSYQPRALSYIFPTKCTFFYLESLLPFLIFLSRPFALHHSLYRWIHCDFGLPKHSSASSKVRNPFLTSKKTAVHAPAAAHESKISVLSKDNVWSNLIPSLPSLLWLHYNMKIYRAFLAEMSFYWSVSVRFLRKSCMKRNGTIS